MIYEPREDSFLLRRVLAKYVKGKRVLDMGTGSGIQARAAHEAGAAFVLAVDIDQASVHAAQKQGIQTRQSDVFANVKETFDVIICNPPYLPQDPQEDTESQRSTTGGKNGDEFILTFLIQTPKHLAPKGCILLLLSSLTPRIRMRALLKKNHMTSRTIAREKLFMEELVVLKIQRTQQH